MSVTKILIVDNFLPWQQLVRRIFEFDSDLNIIGTATDGLEAVQKATQLQPDVILMDISLPKMNGFEATRHIRLLSPASCILFVSGLQGFDFIESAFQAGVLGYVLKSDASTDLVAGVKAVLRGEQFVSRTLKSEFDLRG